VLYKNKPEFKNITITKKNNKGRNVDRSLVDMIDVCLKGIDLENNLENNNETIIQSLHNKSNEMNIDTFYHEKELENVELHHITYNQYGVSKILCFCGGGYYQQDMIYCDGLCATWYHVKCVGLTHDDIERLSANDEEWICDRCTKH
jgi:hypothetical protein